MFRLLERASVWTITAMVALGCGERPLEPRDPTPGVPHFTIETFNINSDDAEDSATIAAVGAANADIVCLQEVTHAWVKSLEAKYADKYPYRLYVPQDGASGLGALSRFPLLHAGFIQGPFGWHPAWHFHVQTPAGWLQVLDVHLRSGTEGDGNAVNSYLTVDADHAYEMKLFQNQLDPSLPTMVVGDFNEGPDGGAIRYLEGLGFTDVLWLYHPGQWTSRRTSVANQFTQDLDHILFDSSVEPLNAWVLLDGNSDHIPVIAHFQAAHPW